MSSPSRCSTGCKSLLDNSLVRQMGGAEATSRFTMLETIREYALDRLETSGEADAVQRRHATYFIDLAQEAAPYLYDFKGRDWLPTLDREHDNLRAALGWLLAHGEADSAMRLAGALGRFWLLHGHLSEGREYLAQILVRRKHRTTRLSEVKALEAAGDLASTRRTTRRLIGCMKNSLRSVGSLGIREGSRSRSSVLQGCG